MTKFKHSSVREEQRLTKLAAKTKRWIASPEGQKSIREALEAAKRATDRLDELRSVSREVLLEPVTR